MWLCGSTKPVHIHVGIVQAINQMTGGKDELLQKAGFDVSPFMGKIQDGSITKYTPQKPAQPAQKDGAEKVAPKKSKVKSAIEKETGVKTPIEKVTVSPSQ